MSAAALIAAGVVSSQAQPVYSQNIVGYASVATPNVGVNYMISIPFAIGVSNGANEIWPLVGGQPTIPDGSSILIWNPATVKFTTYLSDSGSPTLWDDNNGVSLTFSPKLPVGQGFFLNPAAPKLTNTFAGTIAVNVGTSNEMVLPNVGVNYLVGSVVPYAGYITNGNNSTGGLNLSINGGLPDGSSLLIWNPATVEFTTYLSDSGSPSLWDDNNGVSIPLPPSITVGQGFFLSPANPNFMWTVGL
jgi:hypothetical protein